MSTPRPIASAWPVIHSRLQRASNIALLSDLDGTLASIRRHPKSVRLSIAIRRSLMQFSKSGCTIGLVSGRTLKDVRRIARIRAIWYVGTHGFEVCDPLGRLRTHITPNGLALVRRATRHLKPKLASLSGITLENKKATLAIHYRGASPSAQRRATLLARQAIFLFPGLSLLRGKKVLELSPNSRVTKWTAVREILRQARRKHRGPWLVFYFGDDVTDEHVFRKLRGVTVVVGKQRPSAARFCLQSPAEMRKFLMQLLRVRK